jgi:hypothetical protein
VAAEELRNLSNRVAVITHRDDGARIALSLRRYPAEQVTQRRAARKALGARDFH